MVTAPSETAAVIIEPVLGEGGYIAGAAGVPRRRSTSGASSTACCSSPTRCSRGFGRTGKMFAIEHYDVAPDIVCMAKGIASGFPFSALGTRRELDDRWPTGSHGGTYGGNPIGCAAALATIEVLTGRRLPRRRRRAGRSARRRAARAAGAPPGARPGARRSG